MDDTLNVLMELSNLSRHPSNDSEFNRLNDVDGEEEEVIFSPALISQISNLIMSNNHHRRMVVNLMD